MTKSLRLRWREFGKHILLNVPLSYSPKLEKFSQFASYHGDVKEVLQVSDQRWDCWTVFGFFTPAPSHHIVTVKTEMVKNVVF